ncbi:glycosyl hydrolase family 17 protein [Allomuricauda sp. SCSIO 65647]|uniref:glycosyl hydrolase family 17 protein n=1 Tax=Allomuricauda sp. SCSIO 65647 TaxID=2908843 RepID=UPI001F3F7888|nr:glycosyl hydrolase family 17 protein [Muricauda sp. SCSIO 65647]UJH69330.1 glycosyl hydrolase family 17 protein [Muricauda sp. SCSIO 65647]
MKHHIRIMMYLLLPVFIFSCKNNSKTESKTETVTKELSLSAKDILGHPEYLAMSYGGYRYADHNIEPTMDELKEDVKILAAMGIKVLRTYKVHKPQAANLLQAITELKKEDPELEMYVMLGIWIDCLNAWTGMEPDHNQESADNKPQVEEAVRLANKYPDIVKVLAVGNEAMVKWAADYYVQPDVILKWVNHLQDLKKEGKLSKDLWVTSSDNFASWGGGGDEYHVEDLNKLIEAVDFLSIHTYPMHDTHYQPEFWQKPIEGHTDMTHLEIVDVAMLRAKHYAMAQYQAVKDYMESLGISKSIHIGETGWASFSDGYYGPKGSKACDEYKEALYYQHMRDWTNEAKMSCFYFEGFDEPWKGGNNPGNSEKHFGLFTVDGKAKYALWDEVDKGMFEGLTRNGNPITKTYNGDKEALLSEVLVPPTASEINAHH